MTSHQAELPLHLDGNNAPVVDEVVVDGLVVEGTLPPGLDGTFVRNGPNPRTGWSAHLFDGDGMLHAIELDGGRPRRYRNRFVRTPLHRQPGASRAALAFDPASGDIDYGVSTANTSVIAHGGRLLALEEGGFPYEVTAGLDTIGPFTFGGRLTTPMTAHPKACPSTGELLFYGCQLKRPYVTSYRASAEGEIVAVEPITLPAPTMMHDVAVTASRVVFLDSPIVLDRAGLVAGRSPWAWDDDHPSRFGVMPRHGSDEDVVWIEVEPGHVSHVANAYDTHDGRLVVLGTRLPRERTAQPGGFGGGLPAMHRWELDPVTGTSTESPIDDAPSEYPTVPPATVGRHTRSVVTTSFALDARPHHSEIYAYDIERGTRDTYRLPAGHTCGEMVPVPLGDDGALITFAHDRADDRSYVLVLDANDVAAGPVARILLPVRVPAGFHGTWLPRQRRA